MHRPALDGVQIGDVAGGGPEPAAERAEEGDGIADGGGREDGFDRLVARPVAGLRPHGDAARQVEHRYDVHAPKLSAAEAV